VLEGKSSIGSTNAALIVSAGTSKFLGVFCDCSLRAAFLAASPHRKILTLLIPIQVLSP
jgi:hypothetical protein